jgi:hypothetical protein
MSLMFFTMASGFYFITALFYIGYWSFKKNWIGQTATAMTYVALLSSRAMRLFPTFMSQWCFSYGL